MGFFLCVNLYFTKPQHGSDVKSVYVETSSHPSQASGCGQLHVIVRLTAVTSKGSEPLRRLRVRGEVYRVFGVGGWGGRKN